MNAAATDTALAGTDDLRSVLDQIWESITEEPSSLDFGVGDFAEPAGAALLDARVHLLGAWQGRVQLVCARTTAEQLASRILACPVDELEDEDVRDALGEITNIIGGSVKSMLSRVERLSLPVVQPAAAPLGEAAGRVVDTCVAGWQDRPILVRIIADT